MFIFGSGDRLIRGEKLEGFQCPNCKSQQFTALGFIRHFHLYHIPTFPVSKRVAVECCQCKERLLRGEFPDYIANRISDNIYNAKNTAPSFIGLLIVVLMIMAMVLGHSYRQAKVERYIVDPTSNDVYIIDNHKVFDERREWGEYAAMMVTRVDSDETEFVLSNFSYRERTRIDRDIDANIFTWSNKKVILSREQMTSLHQAGAILDITRNSSD